MERVKTIYGQTKQTDKHSDNQPQKRDCIIKDASLTIRLKEKHLEVNNGVLSQIYGIKQIKRLYLHKDLQISIGDVFAISKHLKIYFIDAYGNVVAKYKRIKI